MQIFVRVHIFFWRLFSLCLSNVIFIFVHITSLVTYFLVFGNSLTSPLLLKNAKTIDIFIWYIKNNFLFLFSTSKLYEPHLV